MSWGGCGVKKPKAPLLNLDCLACQETFFFRTPGPHACELCGGPLLVRTDGAEPYEPESYTDAPAARALFDLLVVEAAQVGHGG